MTLKSEIDRLQSELPEFMENFADEEADSTAQFMALVYVVGHSRPALVEYNGHCYYTSEPIAYRHRTGTKTYTSYWTQLSKGRDGKFRPVAQEFLRRPAAPAYWGQGTADRSY